MFGIVIYAAPVFFLGFLPSSSSAELGWLPASGRASPEVTSHALDKHTHFYLIDTLINGELERLLGLLPAPDPARRDPRAW